MSDSSTNKKRKISKISDDSSGAHKSTKNTAKKDIDFLESQATESPKYYNNIVELLSLAQKEQHFSEASLALSRVFTRLTSDQSFRGSKSQSKDEALVQKWLEERYNELCESLLQKIGVQDPSNSLFCLDLLMKLTQIEVGYQGHSMWSKGVFYKFVGRLLRSSHSETMSLFITDYFKTYDDIRLNTLQVVTMHLERFNKHTNTEFMNAFEILSALDEPPQSDASLSQTHFTSAKFSAAGEVPRFVHQAKTHRKRAQETYLVLLRLPLDKTQRKTILRSFRHQIAPWISASERLMDFLTDSFNTGGETSLLALSGLFYLMQEKNLDYPSFYTKLYSLLDSDLLVSKHRSRFFRLLDTFMASTHLPATLVASFIKRLSRLALHSTPAGIVVVIPWVYNMFKRHPSCTFMMHREARSIDEKRTWEEYGFVDPFRMNDPNPMTTGAIDSCVWELVSLSNHWHPNVAALAGIIQEQFTKQSYNMEDFLDYSYNSLLDTELSKELRKTPVVEFYIPKSIFNDDEGNQGLYGRLLHQVMTTAT